MKLFTIGVNKKSAEDFFNILKNKNINKVLDIRLNNNSQLLGYSKGKDLKYFVEKCHDIKYIHLPEFAPTEELLKKYQKDKNWEYYVENFSIILKNRPIIDIFNKTCSKNENICLLCSESSSERCHRRLVAEFILKYNKNIELIHL